jgi:hypothetical protein
MDINAGCSVGAELNSCLLTAGHTNHSGTTIVPVIYAFSSLSRSREYKYIEIIYYILV